MKKYAAGFLLVVLIGFPGFPLFAENDTVHFVIAPPPVGYPEIKKGEKIYQAGTDALFFTTDLNSEKLIVLGATAFGNYQESFTDWFTASLNFGGSFMAGSKYSMMILSLPLHMNGILELLDTEGFDVLYKPKDISLSSQLRFTDNYTMLSVAVKWLVDGFLPKPKGKIQE
jgi:hypothetical protein